MLKFLLLIIILAIGAGYAYNHFPGIRQNVSEIINPQIKEGRLLIDIDNNLKQLDSVLSQVATEGSLTGKQTGEAKKIINQSKLLLNEAQTINQQDTGVVKGVIDKITNSVFTKTVSRQASPTPSFTPCSLPN